MLYDLTSLLKPDSAARPYALVILDQPINDNAFRCVAKSASILVCADGGANRLRALTGQSTHRELPLPDAIVGDLDSLDPSVENYYGSRNVKIIHDPEQVTTDFTKCLRYIQTIERFKSHQVDVVALGGLGGRVDHGLSQLHYLFVAASDSSLLSGQVFLLSERSLSFPLEVGRNRIRCQQQEEIEGEEKKQQAFFTENVGIIPLQGPTKISTNGFEWDVENWATVVGRGQLSTSNHVKADVVEVECDRPVLFTIELAEKLRLEE